LVVSLYSKLYNPTTTAKQRMVERFTGDQLDDRWNTENVVGSNTFRMSDSIDGGFEIVTNTTANATGRINFGVSGIRHYEETGCVMITVNKMNNTSATATASWGFSNVGGFGGNDFCVGVNSVDVNANYTIRNKRTTTTDVASSIAIDTIYHRHNIELISTASLYSIDGILEGTNTGTLPNVKLEPFFQIGNSGGSTQRTGNIKYMEAYNT